MLLIYFIETEIFAGTTCKSSLSRLFLHICIYTYVEHGHKRAKGRTEYAPEHSVFFPFGPTADKVIYRDISMGNFPHEPQAVSDSGGKSGQWQPNDLPVRRRLVNGVLHCGLGYIT